MKLLEQAKKYAKHKYSIIATDAHKRPIGLWKEYQSEIASEDKINGMFSNSRVSGIAVICGKVSSCLEVIDVDSKHDITGQLWQDYIQAITDANIELAQKLLIAKTINGGYHIYYRCETIEGNKKLASRETTAEERENNPHEKVLVLIETRGEGGYVIAAPSAGYEFIQNKPTQCPVISIEERDILLETARSFNQWHEKPITHQPTEPKQYSLSPFDDYNDRCDIVALLEKHGWTVVKETNERIVFKRPGNTKSKTSGDFLKAKKWFSVFTTSSQFEPNRAYLPYAVYAVLECNSDFSKASKQLLSDGYGRIRKKIEKKAEDIIRRLKQKELGEDEIIEELIKKADLSLSDAKETIKNYNENIGLKILTFWDVNPENMKISIVRTKFVNFIQSEGGFALYYYDKNSNLFRIIREEDGLIEEASPEQMKKFVQQYIQTLPAVFDNTTNEDLLEVVYKNHNILFAENFLEFLHRNDVDFLKDTKNAAYFPFKNGVVCVTKDKYELKTYGELKKSIWKSQVINHEVILYNESEVEPSNIEYYKFIQKICGDDPERIEYCMSIIGYLLHKYKDKSNTYSVVLTEETDDEKKGGGTGKGIFTYALTQLINTVQVDGKNFKLDKNFAFQRVKLDTKLIAINDIRKRIDFEGFYSIITEGITIEKKNKDELYIPYEDAPKILFSTNYTIPAAANHAKRRLRVLEFSQYFKENLPKDFFGHQLFDDWDRDEWNRFYNLMFCCVQMYLQGGLKNLKKTTGAARKEIKTAFGEEFLEWLDDYFDVFSVGFKEFKDIYHGFCVKNDFDKKEFSQKRFRAAIDFSSSVLNFEVLEQKDRHGSNVKEIKLVKIKENA